MFFQNCYLVCRYIINRIITVYSFIYILAQSRLQHRSWCCIFLDTCSGHGLCLYQVLRYSACLQNNILNFLTRWVCDKMTVWQVTGWLCDKTSVWKYECVTKMIVWQRWEDDCVTKMTQRQRWLSDMTLWQHDSKMSVWTYKHVSGPCKCQNERQGILRHHSR